MKKGLLIFAVFLFQFALALEGGVSFDVVREPVSFGAIKNLPQIENDFIDLNFYIESKPLNMIGLDDVLKGKSQLSGNLKTNNVVVPQSYEVSLSTGRTKEVYSDTKIESLYLTHKNDPYILFAYAIDLKNKGEYQKSLNIANSALLRDSDNALVHFLKGDILRKMQKYKESINEYIYVTQINPYCADAYYNIGKILELMNEKTLALDYYKIAYEINPEDDEVRKIIMNSYVEPWQDINF